MRKIEYINRLEYTFEPAHKGAPYKVCGTYKNAGELMEMIVKHHLGLDFTKDGKAFDEGSDIEELNASVKSSKATLAPIRGDNMENILCEYFKRVHSNKWIYVVMNDDYITEYHMDKAEFREFTEEFAKVQPDRKVVRFGTSSKRMLRWLDLRV